jgi:hypothetical protein
VKPWQPCRINQAAEGANSILHKGIDKSEILFDNNRISLHIKLILTYRDELFFCLDANKTHP